MRQQEGEDGVFDKPDYKPGEDAGDGDGGDSAAGAAEFDDFRYYFIHLVVVFIWTVSVMPIIMKLLDDKPWNLREKFRRGWKYVNDPKAVNLNDSF